MCSKCRISALLTNQLTSLTSHNVKIKVPKKLSIRLSAFQENRVIISPAQVEYKDHVYKITCDRLTSFFIFYDIYNVASLTLLGRYVEVCQR